MISAPLGVLAGTAVTTAFCSWANEEIKKNLYWAPRRDQSSILKGKEPPYWLLRRSDSRFILLYFHGRGCVVSELVEGLKWFSDKLKISVVCPEYPSYTHDCDRVCNQENLETCATQIFVRLLKAGYNPGEVLVHGYSLGANPALYLADQVEQGAFNQHLHSNHHNEALGGLFLESPMYSVAQVVCDNLQQPGPWNPFTRILNTQAYESAFPLLRSIVGWICFEWENKSRIDRLRNTPVVLSHGKKDVLIQPYQSEWLWQAAKNCKRRQRILHEGDHASCFALTEAVLKKLLRYMEFESKQKRG